MLRSITQMALVGLDDDGCGISSSMMVKHRFQQIPKSRLVVQNPYQPVCSDRAMYFSITVVDGSC